MIFCLSLCSPPPPWPIPSFALSLCLSSCSSSFHLSCSTYSLPFTLESSAETRLLLDIEYGQILVCAETVTRYWTHTGFRPRAPDGQPSLSILLVGTATENQLSGSQDRGNGVFVGVYSGRQFCVCYVFSSFYLFLFFLLFLPFFPTI